MWKKHWSISTWPSFAEWPHPSRPSCATRACPSWRCTGPDLPENNSWVTQTGQVKWQESKKTSENCESFGDGKLLEHLFYMVDLQQWFGQRSEACSSALQCQWLQRCRGSLQKATIHATIVDVTSGFAPWSVGTWKTSWFGLGSLVIWEYTWWNEMLQPITGFLPCMVGVSQAIIVIQWSSTVGRSEPSNSTHHVKWWRMQVLSWKIRPKECFCLGPWKLIKMMMKTRLKHFSWSHGTDRKEECLGATVVGTVQQGSHAATLRHAHLTWQQLAMTNWSLHLARLSVQCQLQKNWCVGSSLATLGT